MKKLISYIQTPLLVISFLCISAACINAAGAAGTDVKLDYDPFEVLELSAEQKKAIHNAVLKVDRYRRAGLQGTDESRKAEEELKKLQGVAKKNYLRLSLKWHPDKYANRVTQSKKEALKTAKKTLKEAEESGDEQAVQQAQQKVNDLQTTYDQAWKIAHDKADERSRELNGSKDILADFQQLLHYFDSARNIQDGSRNFNEDEINEINSKYFGNRLAHDAAVALLTGLEKNFLSKSNKELAEAVSAVEEQLTAYAHAQAQLKKLAPDMLEEAPQLEALTSKLDEVTTQLNSLDANDSSASAQAVREQFSDLDERVTKIHGIIDKYNKARATVDEVELKVAQLKKLWPTFSLKKCKIGTVDATTAESSVEKAYLQEEVAKLMDTPFFKNGLKALEKLPRDTEEQSKEFERRCVSLAKSYQTITNPDEVKNRADKLQGLIDKKIANREKRMQGIAKIGLTLGGALLLNKVVNIIREREIRQLEKKIKRMRATKGLSTDAEEELRRTYREQYQEVYSKASFRKVMLGMLSLSIAGSLGVIHFWT